MNERELTPKEIVAELDRYIVGQEKAKRAVAIALRNRYRRRQLDEELREDVIPKNILMIGPTGVGKTEIARRLAALANAPFVKVEATKYTEVGYVGRDVESMIRELVETSIRMVTEERMAAVRDRARELAEERIVDIIQPLPGAKKQKTGSMQALLASLLGGEQYQPPPPPGVEDKEEYERAERIRRRIRQQLAAGELDDREIYIEVEDRQAPVIEIFSSATGFEEVGFGNLQDILGQLAPRRPKKRKKVTVKEALEILTEEEARNLVDRDEAVREGIARAEESGIVFIDEIDKIVGDGGGVGPDVSREGVQRDILPIIEGSTVQTKHGTVRTDHILFIAAGAFHASKPSDLIPELQGRLPIRVELDALTEEDFVRILTEPKNALVKQAKALLATEGVELEFTRSAIEEIAHIARVVNEQTEDIGARRLHTIMERVLEDISFDAPERAGRKVRIDRRYVRARLKDVLEQKDLSRYIL